MAAKRKRVTTSSTVAIGTWPTPERGDILVFRRKGFVSGVLGWILKRFERSWDGWGWHMAIAWKKGTIGYWILEAAAKGVRVNLIDVNMFKDEIRFYKWLDEPPSDEALEEFMLDNLKYGYDVAVYPLTMLQYLVFHFFKHRIPRLLNNRYTCWELAFWYARVMGKPIQKIHKYPMVTDFLKEVKRT